MGKNKFSVNQATFTQLITGYHHVRDDWDNERRLITHEGRALLELLFPSRSPFVALLDRF